MNISSSGACVKESEMQSIKVLQRLICSAGICVVIMLAIVVLINVPSEAQDAGKTITGLKPDLPLERPGPEVPPEEPPSEEPEDPNYPPTEDPTEDPPTEDDPENPPPEFFDEPIETAEVVFVIDRTGSMLERSTLSIVDEEGRVINTTLKYIIVRTELIRSVSDLSENIKFAIVMFATSGGRSLGMDENYDIGTKRWENWPPTHGEPAPLGYRKNNHVCVKMPVWPDTGKLIEATAANKSDAKAWINKRLSEDEVKGATCTYHGMSAALKMVSSPPAKGKKSPTSVFLLTDGAPNIDHEKYYYGPTVSGRFGKRSATDATWAQQCMDIVRNKILSENIHNATIYTLGIGMNNSWPNAKVWDPSKMDWVYYPTKFNDACRKFLTDLAEATGGHYREVSQ